MNNEDDEMDQDEISVAKTFYVKEGKNNRVLMVMAIGLTNDEDLLFTSFTDKEFKSVKMSMLKPFNWHIIGEQW